MPEGFRAIPAVPHHAAETATSTPAPKSVWRASLPASRPLGRGTSPIQRAFHPKTRLAHHMRIDLGCGYVVVTEQFLHGADVRPILHEMDSLIPVVMLSLSKHLFVCIIGWCATFTYTSSPADQVFCISASEGKEDRFCDPGFVYLHCCPKSDYFGQQC